MAPSMPLVESSNSLSLAEFKSRYLPDNFPSLQYIHPKSNTSYTISLHNPKTISSNDFEACFDLITKTSSSDYATSSVGWRPRQKRKEMILPDMRYLLVKQADSSGPEGFLSFMITYEDGKEVLYVYEVHLAESLRGGGLGRQLMTLVEDVANKVGLEKIMLTVFMANEGARRFYAGLRYTVDDYSPKPRRLRGGVVKEADYVILSKKLRRMSAS